MSAPKQSWFFFRGLVRESGHWAGFLERFAAAFPEREPVALDLPGNGRRFSERSPISVSAMAEAARAEFLERRKESNHLFALSLGGMVGLEWIKRWPEDFQSAVLVNTSVRGLSPFYHRLRPANYARILGMFLNADPVRVEHGILEITSSRPEKHVAVAEEWIRIHRERPVSVANAARQLLAAARFHPPKEKDRKSTRLNSSHT